MDHSNKHQPGNQRVLERIAIKAGPHHGIVEMDREGFVVVIELDPSSSLVSMRLSAVTKLSSRTSERNSDRLVLVHVATHGYVSEAWSELQL